MVQHQHQIGIRLLEQPDFHINGVPEHPHQGEVTHRVVGAVGFICRNVGRG